MIDLISVQSQLEPNRSFRKMSTASSPSKQSTSARSKTPSNQHISLVCVEYPGIVRHLDKMLETVGGLERLSQNYRNSMPRLELRFRPSDPFSHAAFGDRTPANSLLVRTRLIKRKYASGRTELFHETKPLGIIETSYKFKSMCDFQYMPMQRTNFESTVLIDAKIMAAVGQADQTDNDKTTDKHTNSNVATTQSKATTLTTDELRPSFNRSDDQSDGDEPKNTLQSTGVLQDERFVQRVLEQLQTNRSPEYRAISAEIFSDRLFEDANHSFDESAPLFIMPISFSRFDSPSSYSYRNDPKHRDKAIADEIERQNRLSIIGRNRKSRSLLAFLINWNDSVPPKPDPLLLSQIEAQMSRTDSLARKTPLLPTTSDRTSTTAGAPSSFHVDRKLLEHLRKCFDERPVWSRNALIYRLGCLRQDIRHLLTSCAFYYNNGPFRGMWVRFGYDPKKHPESKVYQTLDFRLKAMFARQIEGTTMGNVYHKSEMFKKHVSMKKFSSDKKPRVSLIHKDSFGGVQESATVGTSEQETTTMATSSKSEVELLASFAFQAGLLPPYRQLFYQLQDIRIDEVQTIIHANDGAETCCDEKDGWLLPGSLERIRHIMNAVIEQTLKDLKKDDGKRVESESEECQETLANEEDEDYHDDEVVNET